MQHEACGNGDVVITRLLLEAGADVNMPSGDYNTPLHDAVANGHVDVVKVGLGTGSIVYICIVY